MFNEDFINRLIKLRLTKGVSARDMSLSIGQNANYVNDIESGKALPSMSAFFAICDYLNITPGEFFDIENNDPTRVKQITHDLKRLSSEKMEHIAAIIKYIK